MLSVLPVVPGIPGIKRSATPIAPAAPLRKNPTGAADCSKFTVLMLKRPFTSPVGSWIDGPSNPFN